MLVLTIRGATVLFVKFGVPGVALRALLAVRERSARRVVCLDTGVRPEFLMFVAANVLDGREVHIRDHADVIGKPEDADQKEIRAAVELLCATVPRARYSNHGQHSACVQMVEVGEFSGHLQETVFVADTDADGMFAVLKAIGFMYDLMNADAASISGDRNQRTEALMTQRAWRLYIGLAAAPKFDPENPTARSYAKEQAISAYIAELTSSGAVL